LLYRLWFTCEFRSGDDLIRILDLWGMKKLIDLIVSCNVNNGVGNNNGGGVGSNNLRVNMIF